MDTLAKHSTTGLPWSHRNFFQGWDSHRELRSSGNSWDHNQNLFTTGVVSIGTGYYFLWIFFPAKLPCDDRCINVIFSEKHHCWLFWMCLLSVLPKYLVPSVYGFVSPWIVLCESTIRSIHVQITSSVSTLLDTKHGKMDEWLGKYTYNWIDTWVNIWQLADGWWMCHCF